MRPGPKQRQPAQPTNFSSESARRLTSNPTWGGVLKVRDTSAGHLLLSANCGGCSAPPNPHEWRAKLDSAVFDADVNTGRRRTLDEKDGRALFLPNFRQ